MVYVTAQTQKQGEQHATGNHFSSCSEGRWKPRLCWQCCSSPSTNCRPVSKLVPGSLLRFPALPLLLSAAGTGTACLRGLLSGVACAAPGAAQSSSPYRLLPFTPSFLSSFASPFLAPVLRKGLCKRERTDLGRGHRVARIFPMLLRYLQG